MLMISSMRTSLCIMHLPIKFFAYEIHGNSSQLHKTRSQVQARRRKDRLAPAFITALIDKNFAQAQGRLPLFMADGYL